MQRRFIVHAFSRLTTAIAVLMLLSCGAVPLLSNDTEDDARRIVEKLAVQPGAVVAEVGAGTGDLALVVAQHLGSSGRVIVTELDAAKLRRMRGRVANSRGAAIEAREAKVDGANLPEACCDGLYMRDVYHHFTQPEKIAADLYRSLKPGGRLVIIDFPPRNGGYWKLPDGVPENRGGHGIPIAILRGELEGAGFRHMESINPWRDNLYAVVFEKPR